MSATAVVPKARPAARRVTASSRVARPAPTRAPGRAPAGPRPVRPELRVIDTAVLRRTRRMRAGLWLGVLLVTASLVAVVAFHVVMAQGQLELDRIERESVAEQQRYQELRLEVAQRASAEAIVGRAEATGMVEAGAATFVPVPSDPTTPPPSSGTPSTTAGWEYVKPHLGQ